LSSVVDALLKFVPEVPRPPRRLRLGERLRAR
jgi:hypothetical protein